MRIIRNERLIRRRRAIGQYVPWLALLVLFTGLIISFAKPEWFLAMLGSIVLGLALSMLGGFFAERYASPIAHHEALTRALKGLDDRNLLVQYVLPATHVLLDPGGCTVFVVKSQGGTIIYEDGRWNHKQKSKVFRQLAGQESLGAPHAEAERQVHKLQEWLTRQLPDAEVPVRAAIVFVSPSVTVNADGSPVPALHSKKLKAWLRGPGRRKPMSKKVYRQVVAALVPDMKEGKGQQEGG